LDRVPGVSYLAEFQKSVIGQSSRSQLLDRVSEVSYWREFQESLLDGISEVSYWREFQESLLDRVSEVSYWNSKRKKSRRQKKAFEDGELTVSQESLWLYL
jgi:hypothetical protein